MHAFYSTNASELLPGRQDVLSLQAGSHGVYFTLFTAAVLPPRLFSKSATKRVWLVILNPP